MGRAVIIKYCCHKMSTALQLWSASYRGVPHRGVVAARAPSALLHTHGNGNMLHTPCRGFALLKQAMSCKVAELTNFVANTYIK